MFGRMVPLLSLHPLQKLPPSLALATDCPTSCVVAHTYEFSNVAENDTFFDDDVCSQKTQNKFGLSFCFATGVQKCKFQCVCVCVARALRMFLKPGLHPSPAHMVAAPHKVLTTGLHKHPGQDIPTTSMTFM